MHGRTRTNHTARGGDSRSVYSKVALSLVLAAFPGKPAWAAPADPTIVSLPVTAPSADGAAVSGIYSFAADTSGLPNVASVEFLIGSLRLGVAQTAPYQVSWNTGYGKDGNYSLQAIARDAAGRTIATGERVFNIANRGVTMVVRSPDISQQLAGTVAFQVLAYDPVNYPVIFNLFIDGEFSGYWDIGSAPVSHSVMAVFNLDTTRFANGKHELTVDLTTWKEPVSPHTYAPYAGMLERIISINNGHTLMEVVPNYQHLYLQPGQTLTLSCTYLFTDSTSGPCNAPVYSNDNPAVASLSGGVVQANSVGFTTVVVNDSGKSAKAYVWVKSNLNVPHFSGNSQILTSYQTGTSIFPVAPFVLDPGYIQQPNTLAETKRAGFNTLTFGFYLNARNTSISYNDWKSAQDRNITSRISWARANGFHVIGTGDDGFRRPGDDAWWTLNWAYGRQATQYAMQTMADSGVAIAVNVVDEAPMFWGWYPINPSKVGQAGLPGQPVSFQSVSCNGSTCTVTWLRHGYSTGRWIAFQGSRHPELNTSPGQPFVIQSTTQDSFDFRPSAPITGTFTPDNDPNLETMLFAGWPCNAGSVDAANHPCVPFTANDAVSTYSSWLRSAATHVPFSWPSLGSLPVAAQANWVGQPAISQGISDFATHYWDVLASSRTYSWSSGVQQRTFWMKDAFYSRQPYMAQDRPQLMLVCGSSFAYFKQNPAGAYYDPLADRLDQPGCDGSVATAEIMTAAAIGSAGVREYQFDKNTPDERTLYPVGSYLETGMRPDSGDRNSKEIWQASGYASNLITKVLQPYILGRAVNSPGHAKGITTAVRGGPDATMLMVVNDNDAERRLNIDLTPYRTGTAITRYRLSYSSLRSDLLADTGSDNLTLPRGGSAVYLFPFSSSTNFLKSISFQPQLAVGASQASLSYNYIYSEHITQSTDAIDCSSGCSLQLDRRLGDVYYQFTYTDTEGKVIDRSGILKAKAPAAVNFAASSLNQVYDGLPKTVAVTTNPPDLSTTITYSRNGEIISVPVDAGNYSFVAAVTDPNYQGFAAGTLIVNKGTPTITWPNPAPIMYGTPLDTMQLNATASFNGSAVSGTLAYSPASGTILGAGNQMLSVTFTPGDPTILASVTSTVWLQVNKATPVVSWSKPDVITYGTPLSTAQLNATGSVPGTFSYNPSVGTFLTAGTQNLSSTFAPADSTDYGTVTSAVQISVLPAALNVTANSVSRFYGSANPPLTGMVAGVVNGDIVSATFTTSATTDAQPGKYPITPVINDPNHRLPNYRLDAVNGTLTILPAPVITVSKTGFDFGARDLFSTSEALTLTVGNLGTADLVITAVTLGGMNGRDFALVNNCNNTVAAGAACLIKLSFTPSALQNRSAVLTLTDNTGGYPGRQQTVTLSGNGVMSYAVYATSADCGAVTLSGNAFTDSFESRLGSYAKTRSNRLGDIAVNGNATLSTDAIVNGTIFAPNPVVGACKNGTPGISVSGHARATGDFAAIGDYAPLTPLAFREPPSVAPGASHLNLTSTGVLQPGEYGNVTVTGRATITLLPGSYVVNSLKLSDSAEIAISAPGQVILNVVGLHARKPLDLSGGSVGTSFGYPAGLLIIYGGNGELNLTGKADSYGIVYAPNAAARLSGEADWFGALVVKTLDSSGNSIHYDRSLSAMGN